MKLFYYEATKEYRTEGYIIAEDDNAAKATAEELIEDESGWEEDFAPLLLISEVTDPEKLHQTSYVWAGGAEGSEVSVEEALQILADKPDIPAEIPGQESLLDEGVDNVVRIV